MAVVPALASNLDAINHEPGDLREAIFTLTVGAADTYVTNGFVGFTPAALGMTSVKLVSIENFSTGHGAVYVPATGLIKVFSAAATELANASTALQSATVVIQVIGR